LENANNTEFTVKRKLDGEIFLRKLLVIFAPIIFSIIVMIILSNIVFYLLIIFFTLDIICIWFFMRYTNLEYEYTIVSGDFSIAVIYDNKSRKDVLTVKISEMSVVAPYEEEYIKKHLNRDLIKKIHDYHTDAERKDFYFCTYDDKKFGKTAIIFNTNKKMIQIMKFYNSSAVTVKDNFAM